MKVYQKILAFLFAFGFMTAAKAMSQAATPHYYGDVDKNGAVETSDARSVLRFAVGLDDPENDSDSPTVSELADVDKDGRITPADARAALRTAVFLDATIEFASNATKVDEESEPVEDQKPVAEKVTPKSLVDVAKLELGNDGKTYQSFLGYDGPWCASFISWCLRQAANYGFVNENVVVYSTSCTTIADYYKAAGLWHENDGTYKPSAGDLFFLYYTSQPEDATATDAIKIDYNSYGHIGFVVDANDTSITTVEGNTSDVFEDGGQRIYKVRSVNRLLNGGNIAGFVSLKNKITTNDVPPAEKQEEKTKEPIPKTNAGESLGVFECSAYCGCVSCNGEYSDENGAMTATGVYAKPNHTIAVDPSVIPYGTKVIINGITYTAEDCGGSIKGNKIDIFFDSHEAAMSFGLKTFEVFLAE